MIWFGLFTRFLIFIHFLFNYSPVWFGLFTHFLIFIHFLFNYNYSFNYSLRKVTSGQTLKAALISASPSPVATGGA